MKKILFTIVAAALISACASPASKKKSVKDAKGGPEAADSVEAAPLPPGAEVIEAGLKGAGFDADPEIQPVRFDYDSAQLSPEALDVLKANAAIMKLRKGSEFLVAGHCDDRGTIAYNLALGQKRAKEVRDYYMRLGVDGRSIATISFGKEQQSCAEATEECWSTNRRAVTGIRAKAGSAQK
ncbi:MAG: OmpA family protein [Elusimicrobiota bacterium]|nr:OmpA family protein [Elusimicrobiota bacterium]